MYISHCFISWKHDIINGLPFLPLIRFFQNISSWRNTHWGPHAYRSWNTYHTGNAYQIGNAYQDIIVYWEPKRIPHSVAYTMEKRGELKKQTLRCFFNLFLFSGVLVQNMMGLEYGENVAAVWTLWKHTYDRIPFFFAVWALQGSKN